MTDTELAKKLTQLLNIYGKIPNFKGKPSFKNGVTIAVDMDIALLNIDKKKQENQNKPQKHTKPCTSFYQYMKKDQNLANKNIHSYNISVKLLADNYNTSRLQSPKQNNYRGRSPGRRNSRNFSQNRYSRSNSQNN